MYEDPWVPGTAASWDEWRSDYEDSGSDLSFEAWFTQQLDMVAAERRRWDQRRAAAVTGEELTAGHADHTQFVPGCGTCRFHWERGLAVAEPGKSGFPRYYHVRLKAEGTDVDVSDARWPWNPQFVAAWDWLRDNGYVETYWNWHDSRGPTVVHGRTEPQWSRNTHTFRSPETGQWAWLSYEEERRY